MGVLQAIGKWLGLDGGGVRSSLENPTTSLRDPDAWLFDALGATPSSSGVRVSHSTALTYAAVWRATRLIAGDVAKLPLYVYRREGDGKIRATGHPAYRLLRRKASETMTARQLKMTLTANALLRGNGYAFIDRANGGQPLGLIWLDPARTWPVKESGRLLYVHQIDRGDYVKLMPAEVLHIKGLSYDGVEGYSVIEKARESLGMGLAAREYGSRFFSNNARPNVVIEVPGYMPDEAYNRLKQSWLEMNQGLSNAHKTAILENGAKPHQLSINARDAQLIESRQFEIREVANWFGCPPHKLGDSSRTAYNSLEQENQSYLSDCLDDWLNEIEEECYDKLLTERQKQRDTHIIEFKRQALVRADMSTRYSSYATAISNGWMTRNEARSFENMNPLDGGDELLVPLNMGPPGQSDPGTPDPGTSPPDDDEDDEQQEAAADLGLALRGLAESTTRRMVRRLAVRANKAARAPERFDLFLETLEEDEAETLMEMVAPVAQACCAWRRVDELAESAAAVRRVLAATTEQLTIIWSSTPERGFLAAVENGMTTLETELPATIAGILLGDDDDGT
ncbi:MAG: phage portal protein [Armatimonadia bacterium]|nr:phage portal protein [Armatimonadia bacterium]